MTQSIDDLAEYLSAASRVLVFTGAGISTPSGIRDFRGPRGIWKTRQPVYYNDFMTSEAARIEYWDYKLEGWESFRVARPNEVHLAVTRLDQIGKLAMVVTQNVDGLHAMAGIPDAKLVEIHGTNRIIECQSCHAQSEPDPHFAFFLETNQPPTCSCGGFLKPATVSFGQNLKTGDLERGLRAASQSDLVIAMGSTLSVFPACDIPVVAVKQGASLVVINQGPTEMDNHPGLNLRIDADVMEVFPPAVARI